MDLVRDVLDQQVVDRSGRPLGRIDKIILEMRDDDVPIVSAIEIGLVSIADRIHPFVGRCARAIETILNTTRDRPVRVPFSKIIDFADPVRVDIAARDTNVLAIEELIEPIVTSLPGAK